MEATHIEENGNKLTTLRPDETNKSVISKTNGPSEYLTSQPGFIDRDRPSEASNSFYGIARQDLTSLQDAVNSFLSTRL